MSRTTLGLYAWILLLTVCSQLVWITQGKNVSTTRFPEIFPNSNLSKGYFISNDSSNADSEFELDSVRDIRSYSDNFTASQSVSIPISSFSQPITFDIYLLAKTTVEFMTSDDISDIQMTLNSTGEEEQAVRNIQLTYTHFTENGTTVIQLRVIRNSDFSSSTVSVDLKVWRIVVPVVLVVACVIIVIFCLVRYTRRKGLRYKMKPSDTYLDPVPQKETTIIGKKYLVSPVYFKPCEIGNPTDVFDRQTFNRPHRSTSYRMEGDLDRISEERESQISLSSLSSSNHSDGILSNQSTYSLTKTKNILDLVAEHLRYIDCSESDDSGDGVFPPSISLPDTYGTGSNPINYSMENSTFKAGPEPSSNQSSLKRRGGGLVPINGTSPFTITVMLTVTMVTAVAVYAFSFESTESTLTVNVPSSLHLRKVRSYSKDLSLDVVHLPETSNLKTSVQMYDIEECTRGGTACKALAACDNFLGSYKCRCRTGFYVHGAKCQACSSTCPANHYMSKQCTVNEDVICKPCTVCNGSTYEAAACSTTQDRVCIDVTYPVKGFKENLTLSLNDEGSVSTSASSNVFVEKLSSVNDLQTTFYATNNQQSYDLKNWKRDSGLEITLSIQELYLIPEYRDVDHLSDNAFIEKGYRSTQADKDALLKINKYYCRHPVPDKYNLGLEIKPDRTTSAAQVTCGSPNTTITCPKGYPPGAEYLYRSLNDKCPKIKNQVLPQIKQWPNSIACTDDVSLLHDVFHIPDLKPEPRSYSTARCAAAQKSCDKCVNQLSCYNSSSSIPDNCCHLVCYNNEDCQLGYSPLCPTPPVECATGNAYIYTLEPDYKSLSKKFQCHLTYERKPQLYQVGYSVRLPGMNIDLPNGLEEVTSDDLTFRSTGKVDVGFITLRHDIGMQINEEVILVGKYDTGNEKNFVLYPLKEESELRRDHFRVDQPHESSYLTSVQFPRPFEFSSATWWGTGCNKNVSKLYPAQKLYRKEPVNVTGQVGVINGQIQYQTLPANHIPSIRVTIPGNRSVLSTYQNQMFDAVLDVRTLTATLTGDWNKALWILKIQGELRSCPGILSMELYDKCAGTELGRYDILVVCPTQFKVVLEIAQQNLTFTPAIFSLVLKDANSTYRMYLSAFQQPFYLPIEESDEANQYDLDLESPWKPVIAMTSIALLVVITCVIIYACVSHSRKDNVYIAGQGDRSPTYLSSKELERLNQGEGYIRHSSRRRNQPASKTLLIFFTISYILYSIFFTMSVFFGVLYVSYSNSVSDIKNISAIKTHLKENFTKQLASLSQYEQEEISRLSLLVAERQKACGFHLENEIRVMHKGLKTNLAKQLETVSNRTSRIKNAVLNYMVENANSYDSSLEAFISVYNESLQDKLNVVFVNYKDYLGKVPQNGWLKFAKHLYEGLHERKRPVSASNERGLIKFLTWLGVDKVKDVVLISDKLNKQLTSGIPRLRRTLFSDLKMESERDGEIELKDKDMREKIFKMKFITVDISDDKDPDLETVSTSMDEEFYKGDNFELSVEISAILLPVILCVLGICDVCLLVHRVVRLCTILQQLIWGIKEFIPLDHVSSQVYQISTGRSPPKMYDPLEHPYNYMKDNRDGGAAVGEMYFFPQNMPKAKEDLLRDIWNHKKKPPKTKSVSDCCVCRLWGAICRVVTSEVTWKFTVILALIWVVCVILKLIDSLVTMETFQYLLSVDILLPQLQMNYNTTNVNLENYARFFNIYLRNYNTLLDSEIMAVNLALQSLKSSQERSVVYLVNQACSVLANTTAAKSICDQTVPLFPDTLTIPACNFLPISAQPYIGMQFGLFVSQVNTELSPLVDSVRNCLFSAAYLIIAYLCLLVVLYTSLAAVLKSLRHKGKLPTLGVFQTANVTSAQWPEKMPSRSKDLYPSGSWAQSESGVYLEGEEPHKIESNV